MLYDFIVIQIKSPVCYFLEDLFTEMYNTVLPQCRDFFRIFAIKISDFAAVIFNNLMENLQCFYKKCDILLIFQLMNLRNREKLEGLIIHIPYIMFLLL